MESVHSTVAVDGSSRLTFQLQALTEITEALTYRLLSLEERLVGLDRQLQQLEHNASTPAGLGDEAELRLDETQERLARLESLLNGLEAAAELPGEESVPEDASFTAQDEDFSEEPSSDEPQGHQDSFAEEQPLFSDETLFGDEDSFLDEQVHQEDDDIEPQAA